MQNKETGIRTPWKGLVITLAGAIVIFALSAHLNFFERLYEWSRAHEEWEIDEIVSMFCSLTLALGVFSWRSWRALRAEAIRRLVAEQRLRESEESYRQIVARVAEATSPTPTEQNQVPQPRKNSWARWDLIALLVLVVTAFVITATTNAFERFGLWSVPYEVWQVDEIVIALSIMAAGLVIFSVRRWKELKKEITWREEVENALRRGEQRYRQIVEHATDIIYRTDLKGRFTFCNPAATEILNYTESELLGKHYLQLIKPECRDEIEQFYHKQAMDRLSTTYREIPVVSKEGADVLLGQTVQILSESGHPVGFQAVARDITEHKREEEILRQMEEYRNLFRLARDPILILDPADGHVLDVNDKACETYGIPRESFIDSCLSRVATNQEALRERLQRLLAGGEVNEFETVHVRNDGSSINLLVSPTLIDYHGRKAVFSLNRDITARKKAEGEREQLEHQLRQSQKLESIGHLAGGVAHDFNNLLTVINGYSEMALNRLETDSPLHKNIEEIKKAGQRAASLTSQLLAFSRKQVLKPKVLDLNSIVADVDKMLRRLIGEDIGLATSLEPNLGQIKADPGQIEQVIMNLAINARDAMPKGGKLTIETRQIYLHEPLVNKHFSIEPGHYITLAVSDTGTGMDKEIQKQIFDPFFTTKEVGRGTGLGLSTVYGIVKQSGGDISVYSEPGQGTTFRVYFPRHDEVLNNQELNQVFADTRGHETILLVEDDDMVRALSQELLEINGYTVLPAANGNQGMQVCREFKGKIDLLITDVVMPEMNGRELAANFALLRPETRILFMSGYTDDAIVRHGVLEEKVMFLQKPFLPDSLARKTREVLDRPAVSVR